FTDNDENVLYAIWVDGSVWGKNDTVYAAVEDLYSAIVWDANAPTGVDAILAELAKYDSADKITSEADRVDATNAIVAAMDYIDANTTTSAERCAISDAIDLVEAAHEIYINGNELTAAKAEAQAKYDALIEETAKDGTWPEGAVEAAKAAVAEKLADMIK